MRPARFQPLRITKETGDISMQAIPQKGSQPLCPCVFRKAAHFLEEPFRKQMRLQVEKHRKACSPAPHFSVFDVVYRWVIRTK